MRNKYHTQLYIQGMVSHDYYNEEVKCFNDSLVRIGKSGQGASTYKKRVKELNSSKAGTLMPYEVYCKRAWEFPNDTTQFETVILKFFKALTDTKELRYIRGDWFYDENGIIKKHITNIIDMLNIASEKSIVEITEKTAEKETDISLEAREKRQYKRESALGAPTKFLLDGVEYPVKSWKDCLESVIEVLYKKEGDKFVQEALSNQEFRGRSRRWFAENKEDLYSKDSQHLTSANAEYMQNPGIYYDKNQSGSAINQRCKTLANTFGYNFSVVVNGKESDTRDN